MSIYSRRSGRDERATLYPVELLPLFDDSFITSFDLFEEYVARLTLSLFRTTGLEGVCSGETTAASAVERLGLDQATALVPATWLLAMLASRNWINTTKAADGSKRYRIDQPLPALDSSEIFDKQRVHDSRCLPSYDIAALAAAHYPSVMQGQTTGEQALFGPEGILPWVKYFSGDNPLYAVSNAVGAIAATDSLPPGDCSILELGGGLGSGADTLLEQLMRSGKAAQLSSYRLTEISPLFLKRARRKLSAKHPHHALSFAELDIDGPFPQDVAASGSFSLVYGVNILHVARDLAATLGEVHKVLRDDGVLVMAECVRPFADGPLPIELVFNLLDSFRNPVLVPDWRPNGGFLTPEQWVAALNANGFTNVCIYPDIAAIRDAYPSFMVAAIIARRK